MEEREEGAEEGVGAIREDEAEEHEHARAEGEAEAARIEPEHPKDNGTAHDDERLPRGSRRAEECQQQSQ